VVAFVAIAGCSSVLGPGGGGNGAANASYDWDTNGTNASINVTGGSYTAVYNVSNESTFPIFQRNELGQNQPLPVSALQFQYPNGTVVTPTESSALNVSNERERAVINLPAKNGRLGFTASAEGKRFDTRTFAEGSYEVTIPKGMRVNYEPLAKVSPGYTNKRLVDGRVQITWDDVDSSTVVVRYYLQRDLYLFFAGAVVLVVVAAGGALYYLRQIRELERQRKEAGPDVDTTGSGSDDGPPGFG